MALGLQSAYAQSGAHFETGSDQATEVLNKELMKFYENNLEDKMDKVVLLSVIGHTDIRGGEAYNQKLSERRAASVKAILEHMGVDPNKVATSGKGESMPISEDHAKNRRIELVIRYSNGVKTVVISEGDCEKLVSHRNRVSVLAGRGPMGNIKESGAGTSRKFETEQDLVLGLQYLRDEDVDEDGSWHWGIQGQTNKTFLIMLGVGY